MSNHTIEKAPKGTRVLVAMSGGVDSSVTAALYKKEGYDVIGVTLRLCEHGGAVKHADDASRVAAALGIEHHILDYREIFQKSVIDPFCDSYLSGETPIPCVICNRLIKFGGLMSFANDVGASSMATGHYVRREIGVHGAELHKADDAARDQSYFLHAITRDQLTFARFPLAHMEKAETRALAREFGLPVAEKTDSQDICFIPGGDYAGFVNRERPNLKQAGEIVDMNGTVLGEHQGIINFTVGQRRGLNISDRVGDHNDPLFVIRLDASQRRVVVGPRSLLAKTEVSLDEVNWLGDSEPSVEGEPVEARLRSAQKPVPATYFPLPGGKGLIRLKDPVMGVAPGQAGVLYSGTRVLGGGWIKGSA